MVKQGVEEYLLFKSAWAHSAGAADQSPKPIDIEMWPHLPMDERLLWITNQMFLWLLLVNHNVCTDI